MELIPLPEFDELPSRGEVCRRIAENWQPPLDSERIPVAEAYGRVPAADVAARVNIPLVRASTRDGVAVASACFADGAPDTSGWVLGRDFVRADTGDDFDDAFDAVITIEDVDLTVDGKLSLHEGVQVFPGLNVRGPGSTVREGDPLVRAFQPLRPKDLASLQMGAVDTIEVVKKPRVAFIPTGSELIAPGTPLSRGKNIDTNSIMAAETLRELGAEPLPYPIVMDEETPIEAAMNEALAVADIIVINGGSSKGDEDCTARLLHRRGDVLCHGTQAVPGKPLCVAIIDGKPVINLPGPFMAAYHGLEWCVNYVVRRALGLPIRQRPKLRCTLTQDLEASGHVSFLAIVEVARKRDGSGYLATPHAFKDLPTWRAIAANGQYMTPLNGFVPAGGEIEVDLLCDLELIPLADEE